MQKEKRKMIMNKHQLIKEFIVAVRATKEKEDQMFKHFSGLLNDIDELQNDRLIWDDKVIHYLLEGNGAKIDAFFDAVYSSDKTVDEIMEKIVCQ